MVNKILLVEDNQEISKNIKEYLELEDYNVDTCFGGECGLDNAIDKNYDLILLDLMLPEIDGFRIAEKISSKKTTPIIMITAKENIDDKLKGFKAGAIDYLVKPFDLRELLARIEIALNKNLNNSTHKIIFDDLEIDIEKRKFIKSGNRIKVTQKEFLLLELLLKSKGTPVSRTDIIEYIWGGDSLFENDPKLDVYISVLRSKLGKSLIKTIKGFGYEIE